MTFQQQKQSDQLNETIVASEEISESNESNEDTIDREEELKHNIWENIQSKVDRDMKKLSEINNKRPYVTVDSLSDVSHNFGVLMVNIFVDVLFAFERVSGLYLIISLLIGIIGAIGSSNSPRRMKFFIALAISGPVSFIIAMFLPPLLNKNFFLN